MKTYAAVVWMTLVMACASSKPAATPAPQPAPAPTVWPVDAVPAQHQPTVERARTSMTGLQQKLGARLLDVLGRDGAVAALDVCRLEAASLAKDAQTQADITVGRTSHKLRNPDNAPRDWVKPHLDAAAGKPVDQVKPVVVNLGDSLGVLQPIGVMAPCLQCHGVDGARAPGVDALLQQHYPKDQATGFVVGDFRGFLWAQVPKAQ